MGAINDSVGKFKNQAWEHSFRAQIHARFCNFPTESFIAPYGVSCTHTSDFWLFSLPVFKSLSVNPVFLWATRLFLTATSNARGCPTRTQSRFARVIAV